MPIPVVCANCQTRLNAPDAAAGKKVKCPKCQAVMSVPAAAAPPPPPPDLDNPFSFDPSASSPPPPRRSGSEPRPTPRPTPPPEPEAPPPAAGGGGGAFDFGAAVSSAEPPAGDRPRRRRRDEDDDAPPPRGDRPRRRPRDDDADAPEDDDRPRGRRRSDGEKKKSPLMMLLLAGGLLLLLCCGGGGVVGYIALGKIKEAAERKRAELDALEKRITDEQKKRDAGGDAGGGGGGGSIPAGWTKYEAPDKSFKASFPNPPTDGGLTFRGQGVQSAKSYRGMTADGDLACTFAVVKFGSKGGDREKTLADVAGLMSIIAKNTKAPPRAVDWLGGSAKETELPVELNDSTMVTRWVLIGNTGYIAQVQHKNRPDAVSAFFNNVEALSK